MLQRNVRASFLVMLALASGPVLAQQPQGDMHHPGTMPPAATAPPAAAMPGGMPMMGMMRMMGSDGMGMSMMPAMAGHVEGRLAYLKTELKITDAQLPLWNAVADAIRADAKAMSDMSGGMMGGMPAGTLPDKVAMREKMLTTHLEALHRFKMAVDPLYAALGDDQKKTADELLMGPMGMGSMGMM